MYLEGIEPSRCAECTPARNAGAPSRLRTEFSFRTGHCEQAGVYLGVSAAPRRTLQRRTIYNPGPEPASVTCVVQPEMLRHDLHHEGHAARERLQQGRAVDVAAVDSVLSSELEFAVRGFQTLVAKYLR